MLKVFLMSCCSVYCAFSPSLCCASYFKISLQLTIGLMVYFLPLFFFLYYIWKDLSREELAIAKRYPAQTALCIRDGWEFCRPDHAAGA